jgi:hypothetical protein
MVAQVGYSVAGRLGGWLTLCAICTMHVETRSAGFLVEPQIYGQQFVSGLTSKPLGHFSPVWPQNRWRRFSPVCPQNWRRRFLRFDLKTSGGGFLVKPQNQGGGGFIGLSLKTGSYNLVIWTSKSP